MSNAGAHMNHSDPAESSTAMNMTPNIELPQELWDQVLSYVIKRDLKSLRLAGKWHVADMATPLLFATAYIAARKGVLDAFTGLCNHPVLRHHVKSVIYDNSWIDPYMPGEFTDDWSSAIEAVHNDKRLAVAFALQEEIQMHELRPALVHAFESFPNLQKILYDDLARTAGLPGDNLESCPALTPDENPHVQRILCRKFSNNAASCCLNKTCGARHSNFFRRQYGGLAVLLELMQTHHPASLQEFSTGDGLLSGGCFPPGIPAFFLYPSSRTFTALIYILTYLHKFDLTICYPTLTYAGPDAAPSVNDMENGLKKLLETAENLEELSLRSRPSPNVLRCDIDDFWPNKALGSLRILNLKTCRASYKQLSNIIWCNRHTLQRLQLDDFELLTESWPTVTKFCQKHAPSLTVVYGSTWYRGRICSADWELKSESDGDDSKEAENKYGDEQDKDQDGPYSDGEDFVHTSHIVGYKRKERRAGDPEGDDDEYEDIVEVKKTLIESSDEELEYESDEHMESDSSDFKSNFGERQVYPTM